MGQRREEYRVGIVHDFLYTYAGAERVLESLIELFPNSDLFALFDFVPAEERSFLKGKQVRTSFIQKLPFASRKHRIYLPLMPLAIEQLDVSSYDIVVSSSYAVAKGVITGPGQVHICYCHSPVRYAWDLQHQYLDESGIGFGLRGMLTRAILHYIRNWDVRSSNGVDHFVANSNYVAERIRKCYRRPASVVHPPVDTSAYLPNLEARDDFYLVAGRMVPYKKTSLLARAFSRMPEKRLVVIGDGPDMAKVKSVASSNIELMGYQSQDVLVEHMQRAKALVFAAEEDFGIVPVEALSCGTPVIAFGRGGVTDSVSDGEHGFFFQSQTEESIIDAIDRFEAESNVRPFSPSALARRSETFSRDAFKLQMRDLVERVVQGRSRRGLTETVREAEEALQWAS